METTNETNQEEAERTAPVETAGDIMSEATRRAIKFWVIVAAALVYLGGIVYAEVHGLNVLTKGVPEDMKIWATLGMIAAGITAVALPLAHLTWTFEGRQRIAAMGFYLLDFAFLALNAVTDFNVNTGQQLAPWAKTYMTYILPASPLIVAAGWALLIELDPSARAHVLRQTLRAAILEAKANQIAQAAKAESVSRSVAAAAEREVQDALTELFGKPVSVNDEEDDGWQIWRDGYEQGRRYQQTAPLPVAQANEKQQEDKPEPGGNGAGETDAKLEYRTPPPVQTPAREERK